MANVTNSEATTKLNSSLNLQWNLKGTLQKQKMAHNVFQKHHLYTTNV